MNGLFCHGFVHTAFHQITAMCKNDEKREQVQQWKRELVNHLTSAKDKKKGQWPEGLQDAAQGEDNKRTRVQM
jgi:2'-5' RNA ligase